MEQSQFLLRTSFVIYVPFFITYLHLENKLFTAYFITPKSPKIQNLIFDKTFEKGQFWTIFKGKYPFLICIFAFLLSHQIPLSRDIKMEDVWCMKILKKSHLTTLRVASYFTLKYDFCPKNWILPKLENETFWPFSNTVLRTLKEQTRTTFVLPFPFPSKCWFEVSLQSTAVFWC